MAVIKMGEVYAADMIDDADRDRLDLSIAELERLSVRGGDLLFCRTSLIPDGVGHCALVRSLSGSVRSQGTPASASLIHGTVRGR